MADRKEAYGAINLFTIAIVLSLIAATFLGYLIISTPQIFVEKGSVLVVSEVDKVEVDYIGSFQNGKIFDTSFEDVAKDDAAYPKALSFTPRPSSGYRPLKVYVGSIDPEPFPKDAYNLTIEGFWRGMIGMEIGETRTLVIPPNQGYGSPDPNLIQTKPLIQDVVMKEELNESEFEDRFYVKAAEGITIRDPFWQWNVTVLDITGGIVTFLNTPFTGMKIKPYDKWEAEVIYVDSSADGGKGVIKVKHLLSEKDENQIIAADRKGNFIIVSVDTDAGTYTVDYNPEVVGKTLIFQVTIVSITKGP